VNGKKAYEAVNRARAPVDNEATKSTPTETQHDAWKEEKQSTILL